MCSVLAWADILAAPGPRKVGAVIPVDKTGLHCGILVEAVRALVTVW